MTQRNLSKYLTNFVTLCNDKGITIGKRIGVGGFGWVYEGILTDPFPNDPDRSLHVAVKLVEYKESNKATVDREVNIQMSLDNPNVVRVFAHYVKLPFSYLKKDFICYY